MIRIYNDHAEAYLTSKNNTTEFHGRDYRDFIIHYDRLGTPDTITIKISNNVRTYGHIIFAGQDCITLINGILDKLDSWNLKGIRNGINDRLEQRAKWS